MIVCLHIHLYRATNQFLCSIISLKTGFLSYWKPRNGLSGSIKTKNRFLFFVFYCLWVLCFLLFVGFVFFIVCGFFGFYCLCGFWVLGFVFSLLLLIFFIETTHFFSGQRINLPESVAVEEVSAAAKVRRLLQL